MIGDRFRQVRFVGCWFYVLQIRFIICWLLCSIVITFVVLDAVDAAMCSMPCYYCCWLDFHQDGDVMKHRESHYCSRCWFLTSQSQLQRCYCPFCCIAYVCCCDVVVFVTRCWLIVLASFIDAKKEKPQNLYSTAASEILTITRIIPCRVRTGVRMKTVMVFRTRAS